MVCSLETLQVAGKFRVRALALTCLVNAWHEQRDPCRGLAQLLRGFAVCSVIRLSDTTVNLMQRGETSFGSWSAGRLASSKSHVSL
jgi:hypothetical protein